MRISPDAMELYPSRIAPGPLLQRPGDLLDPGLSFERALRLRGARVVFADYRTLQHDFPELRDQALADARPAPGSATGRFPGLQVRRAIDRWLLRHAALVSTAQAAQSRVNSPIATDPEPVEVVRPSRYGRAFLSPTARHGRSEGAGMLDLKGVGVEPSATPRRAVHFNGLMYLGEALADLMMQRLIDAVFVHAGTEFSTLPVYAVLDTGFDYLPPEGRPQPAGIQVRRAHRRPPGSFELPRHGTPWQRIILEIENLLRRYGITSCNEVTRFNVVRRDGEDVLQYSIVLETEFWSLEQQLEAYRKHMGRDGPRTADGVNIQLTREILGHPPHAQLVDFGQFRVHPRFEHPLVSLVRDRVLRWGGVIPTDSPDFVQPSPGLRVPMAIWGRAQGAEEQDPEAFLAHNAWKNRIYAFQLARDFRDGRISPSAMRERLEEPVLAAVRKWRRAGRRP